MEHYLHGTRTRSGEFIPSSYRLWKRMRQRDKQIPTIRTDDKPFFIRDDVYLGSGYICIIEVDRGTGPGVFDAEELL